MVLTPLHQVSIIPRQWTQREHDMWTEYLVHRVLFGPVLIWDHPEFHAMRDGFDISLGRSTNSAHLIRVCLITSDSFTMLSIDRI